MRATTDQIGPAGVEETLRGLRARWGDQGRRVRTCILRVGARVRFGAGGAWVRLCRERKSFVRKWGAGGDSDGGRSGSVCRSWMR